MSRELDNLSGKEFGIWEVLEFDHIKYHGTDHKHGMSYYKCQCKKCGAILVVPRSQLLQNVNVYHYGCKNDKAI